MVANTQGYGQSRDSVDSKSTSWLSAPELHQERLLETGRERGAETQGERGPEIQRGEDRDPEKGGQRPGRGDRNPEGGGQIETQRQRGKDPERGKRIGCLETVVEMTSPRLDRE